MEATGNLSELEEKIASLERSEFDLKMQVFYLNKKLADTAQQAADPDHNVINVNMIEDRSVDILALRDDLEYSRQRITELESEVLQLQLTRDNDALEYQKLMLAQPSTDVALLEESRKREREIAKTLADHDTALISKLQSEIDTLQQQHEQDGRLLDACTARLATQTEVVESKDLQITHLQFEIADLSTKVSVLTDTARQQEQLLAAAEQTKRDLAQREQELAATKQENASLKDQITRQEGLMATQAESLAYLRATASQAGQAENEALLTVNAELSQALDAKDEAILTSQRLQYDNEVLRRQLGELRNIRGIPAPPETAHKNGRFGEQSPATVDPKIVDAYKKREAELLAALEGVIQRCQELEQQHHHYQAETQPSPTSARRILNNRPDATPASSSYVTATPGVKSTCKVLSNASYGGSLPAPLNVRTSGQYYSGAGGAVVPQGPHTDGRRSAVPTQQQDNGNSRSKSADKRRSWH